MEKRKAIQGIKAIIISIIWAAIMIMCSYLWDDFSKEYIFILIAMAYVHISLITSNKNEKKRTEPENDVTQS